MIGYLHHKDIEFSGTEDELESMESESEYFTDFSNVENKKKRKGKRKKIKLKYLEKLKNQTDSDSSDDESDRHSNPWNLSNRDNRIKNGLRTRNRRNKKIELSDTPTTIRVEVPASKKMIAGQTNKSGASDVPLDTSLCRGTGHTSSDVLDKIKNQSNQQMKSKRDKVDPWDPENGISTSQTKNEEEKSGKELHSTGQKFSSGTSDVPMDTTLCRGTGHTKLVDSQTSIKTLSDDEKDNRLEKSTNNGIEKTTTFKENYTNVVNDKQITEIYGSSKSKDANEHGIYEGNVENQEYSNDKKIEKLQTNFNLMLGNFNLFCKKLTEKMDLIMKKSQQFGVIEKDVNELKNSFAVKEEKDQLEKEFYDKKLNEISNIQQELMQPALFVDKNGILFRKILVNEERKGIREIEVGKTMNYDMDTIEKMNERLIKKQKRYEQTKNKLGLSDFDTNIMINDESNKSNDNSNSQNQTNITQSQEQSQTSSQQLSNPTQNRYKMRSSQRTRTRNRQQQQSHTNKKLQKSKDLPGTKKINFTKLKRQIGLENWRKKSYILKKIMLIILRKKCGL